MELTAQVLRDLPPNSDPDLLVGADHFEDAGVYRINETTAIVQTVDFFPPLVNDPYTFGRIAAANSLSDIYAMGARPITALNVVGFPDQTVSSDVLNAILRGGSERVSAAGAVIVGGHSVRDEEIKYGLALTGIVHPDHFIGNNTAETGDVLVLTKPLGIGTLTSAAMSGRIPEADLAETIDVMIDLNRGACEAMVKVGVHAATDVTGFGLIGHAFEMAEPSGTTFEIEAAAVPLLEQAYDLAAQGILTRTHKACHKFLGNRLSSDGVDEVLAKLLADAQTSGGLLISVAASKTDELLRELYARKTRCAAVIGRVIERGEHVIILK